jgi:hypothetical protein
VHPTNPEDFARRIIAEAAYRFERWWRNVCMHTLLLIEGIKTERLDIVALLSWICAEQNTHVDAQSLYFSGCRLNGAMSISQHDPWCCNAGQLSDGGASR